MAIYFVLKPLNADISILNTDSCTLDRYMSIQMSKKKQNTHTHKKHEAKYYGVDVGGGGTGIRGPGVKGQGWG